MIQEINYFPDIVKGGNLVQEVLAIIERIVEEHKTILERAQALDRVANDAEALIAFQIAKDAFMPGRLEHKDGLNSFMDIFEKLESGLRSHFNYEETALMSAFQRLGDSNLISALHVLLLEHKDLRERLDDTRKYLNDLISGGLTRHTWEASAYDLRAHITHTRKLLEAHAGIEMELFGELRKKYKEGAED